LTVQRVKLGNLSTRLYLAVLVDADEFGLTANELVDALRFENIVGRRFLDPPVHRMSYYRGRFGDVSLPVTESIASRAVALPLYSDMTLDEVMRITAAVRQLNEDRGAVRARLTSAPATA
jgi:dTDP-4-amino-4,6-dideoxygalactose transaminase